MKKIFLLYFIFLCCSVFGQTISVSSFKLLDTDLTANTAGTMELDQNGETAALIKVVTTQTGFTFDGGALGIVKTKQTPGEIWVYIPRGSKKITIKHPQLGVLRDYFFPIAIESARTYEMVIAAGEVITRIKQDAGGQYLIMNVTPSSALVYIDDIETTSQNGVVSKFLPYGEHSYRISDPMYKPEAGNFNIGKEKCNINIELKPDYGKLEISSNPPQGVKVFIDEEAEPIGSTPFITRPIKKGSHKFRFQINDYETKTINHVVHEDGSIQPLSITLNPNFANITIKIPNGSHLFINGEDKGAKDWTGRLTEGMYQLELKKQSHVGTSQTINVKKGEDQIITMSDLTPIYGSLNINSNPVGANILINGIKKGTTPDIIDNILIGNHKIIAEKPGYKTYNGTIEIKENQITALVINLEKDNYVNNGLNNKKIKLVTSSDSLSYTAGYALVNGLNEYIKNQGIDPKNMEDFIRGLKDGLIMTPEKKAVIEGYNIARQTENKMLPGLIEDFKPQKSINKEIFYKGFIDALMKNFDIFTLEQAEAYYNKSKPKKKDKK